MRIIEPSFVIMTEFEPKNVMRFLESVGRTCYKSEDRMTDESAEKFMASIIARHHESVVEHFNITVRIVCDRGVSHELVRHRIASFSQESTRYVNYQKQGIEFIRPYFYNDNLLAFDSWENAMMHSESIYNQLIGLGSTPEEARSVLPNSLKTEIVITANIRQWRHFFELRCNRSAHPQMRQLAIPMLLAFRRLPILFDDIDYDQKFSPKYYAKETRVPRKSGAVFGTGGTPASA